MADTDVDEGLLATSLLLRTSDGRTATLHDPRLVKDGIRCRVIRYQVTGDEPALGSVIVKQLKNWQHASNFFSDWASLSFLTHIPEARGIAPRFHDGEVDACHFAMEDLGGSRSLEDLLMGPDRPALHRALTALSIQNARLHAATVGREDQFDPIRRALPGSEGLGRHREAEKWLAGLKKIYDWFAAAGCPLPVGFEAAFSRIADLYAEPGPFLCFTHGDPAPTNSHIADSEVRLLDFEYGGFRHALYDLTAWQVLCPLPAALVRQMSDCYRMELSKACRAAQDEERYNEAWAALCAYRAFAMLTWSPLSVLANNQPWVGDWTMRQALLTALIRANQASCGLQSLQPIAAAAARLAKALQSRWPEPLSEVPDWPALRPFLE